LGYPKMILNFFFNTKLKDLFPQDNGYTYENLKFELKVAGFF